MKAKKAQERPPSTKGYANDQDKKKKADHVAKKDKDNKVKNSDSAGGDKSKN